MLQQPCLCVYTCPDAILFVPAVCRMRPVYQGWWARWTKLMGHAMHAWTGGGARRGLGLGSVERGSSCSHQQHLCLQSCICRLPRQQTHSSFSLLEYLPCVHHTVTLTGPSFIHCAALRPSLPCLPHHHHYHHHTPRPPVPVPAELLAASGHTAAEDELDADLQEKYIDSSSRKHSSKARSTAAGATGINTASSSAQDGGVSVSRQETNAARSSGGQQEQNNSSSTGQHGVAAREQQRPSEQQQQPCRQDVLQPAGTNASSAIQQQQQLSGADVAAVAAAAAAAASHGHESASHALLAVGSTGIVVERHTAAPDPADLSS